MYKSALLSLVCALLLLVGSGCATKKVTAEPQKQKQAEMTQEQAEPAKEEVKEPVEPAEPKKVAPTPMEEYAIAYAQLPLQHEVVKGECLWWIAEYKKIYNDPFMWPLIYKANRDKINDPDLIYPGQVFYIPRTFSLENLKASRQSAGARKPYLPPRKANIPADLRADLGWEF
jgi:LysM repeat protein